MWRLIDPLSVGRRKKSSNPLNDAGFALLWKCASIAQRRAVLASDAALAHRYAALCTSRDERKLEVSAAHLIFRNTDAAGLPRNESCPIVKITTEGRSVVAQVTTRGHSIGYVFRRLHSVGSWSAKNITDARRRCTRPPRCFATTRNLLTDRGGDRVTRV